MIGMLMVSSKYRVMVKLCHTCDTTDKMSAAFDYKGVKMHINKRMLGT